MTTSRVFVTKNNPPPLKHAAPQVEKPPAPRRKKQHKPANYHDAARFVPPDHDGKVVICAASGPSLTTEVIETIRPYHEAGRVVMAGLNDTYRVVDYLDEFYACDTVWWKHHIENPYFADGKSVLDIPARMWGNQTAWKTLRHYPFINIVQGFGHGGFSPDRKCIHWGSNSGHQLLNLVWNMQPRRILLVGYDMHTPASGQQHFFGKHAKGMSQSGNYKGFVKVFRKIQPEIRQHIINCTPGSALDAFEFGDLQKELDAT